MNQNEFGMTKESGIILLIIASFVWGICTIFSPNLFSFCISSILCFVSEVGCLIIINSLEEDKNVN